LLENHALQLTYAANVSLIDATIPLLTGLLAFVLFRKRLFGVRSARPAWCWPTWACS
jgi:drug/metabolite transporter (DMT)-like permease